MLFSRRWFLKISAETVASEANADKAAALAVLQPATEVTSPIRSYDIVAFLKHERQLG